MGYLWQRASDLLGLSKWPQIHGLYVFNLLVLSVTPALAIYGARHVPLRPETGICGIIYFFVTTFGEHSLGPLISVYNGC